NNAMMAASWLPVVKAGLIVVPTMPLLRAIELKPIVEKARITAVLCDKRLSGELQHCFDDSHPAYCAGLKQVRYFHDSSPDSLENIAKDKPAQFTPCDSAAD